MIYTCVCDVSLCLSVLCIDTTYMLVLCSCDVCVCIDTVQCCPHTRRHWLGITTTQHELTTSQMSYPPLR